MVRVAVRVSLHSVSLLHVFALLVHVLCLVLYSVLYVRWYFIFMSVCLIIVFLYIFVCFDFVHSVAILAIMTAMKYFMTVCIAL